MLGYSDSIVSRVVFRGALSTPEQSNSYSDARVSSTQTAETIDIVTQILF